MAATLKQIAEATGLSFSTVSNVLNTSSNRGHLYRPETRELVNRVAVRLGYRPNAAARSMVNGRFGSVALLLSTVAGRSILPSNLVDGIEDALCSRDYHLLLARLPDEKLTDEGFVPKILQEWVADGLLVNYNAQVPEGMISLIQEHHIPAIWINFKYRNNCVYPDDLAAGALATRRLLELGHRRIAYVDYVTGKVDKPWHYSAIDRYEGYATAMREADLSPELVAGETGILKHGKQRVLFTQQWLAKKDRPTAVVCYSEEVAESVILGAATVGISVPEQLSVISFGDGDAFSGGMAVGSVVIPQSELGKVATEMLMQRIENPDQSQPARMIRGGLHEGDTVRPAKA